MRRPPWSPDTWIPWSSARGICRRRRACGTAYGDEKVANRDKLAKVWHGAIEKGP
jgi:hypothetical protein